MAMNKMHLHSPIIFLLCSHLAETVRPLLAACTRAHFPVSHCHKMWFQVLCVSSVSKKTATKLDSSNVMTAQTHGSESCNHLRHFSIPAVSLRTHALLHFPYLISPGHRLCFTPTCISY